MRRLRTAKGGGTVLGKTDTGSREELLGLPSREESVDEWWRSAGGGAVQVDGRSAPGRYGGGEKRMLRKREVESTGVMEGDRG